MRTPSRLAASVLTVGVLAVGALSGCGSDETSTARDGAAPSSAGSSSTPGATTSSTPTPADPTGSTGSAGATDPAADAPRCAAVWQDGARLPRRYDGCVQQGALVDPDKLGCSSGQALVRFGDRFWGVAGGRVHRAATTLDDDADYRRDVAGCRA